MNVIKMPAGGQTSDEAMILRWHKKTGDEVARGDILFEIETDKATLEVESYCEGYLLSVLYGEGEKVSAGVGVAYIGEKDETVPTAESKAPQAEEDGEDEYRPILKSVSETAPAPSAEPVGRIGSSPLAKKTAKELGANLQDVPTPDGGIVKKRHVLEYAARLQEPDETGVAYVPTSGMRKAIARRMSESAANIPQFTVSMEIDMTACIRLRETLNARLDGEVKISFQDIIAKCAAKAAEKFPMINATYTDEQIAVYRDVNIGFAVSVENGLVVPVVHKVNEKTLSQIARANADHIQRARESQLTGAQLSGATMTISNLGMYGVERFTAIVNPPESCILALGAIAEKAVSENGNIVSGMRMNIVASFDHRIIDGALGARFLREVKDFLESPELLLV